MANKRVLVTGAGGYMASRLIPALAERYTLRLADIEAPATVPGVDDVHAVDLTGEHTSYHHLFEGVDTVVHLGYRRSSPGGVYDTTVPHIDRFDDELANVRMAYNVYRGALESGVGRVVVASSNHAADWYEHALVHAGSKDLVDETELPLSDNFYGWSKAAYELLAYPFACGTFGRRLEVVLIRIGAPRDVDATDHIGRESGPAPSLPGGIAGLKRDLGAYLGVADGAQLFVRAIDTDDIRNEHGVPWLVVYGISANTRAFWSLASARRVLGYAPMEDSESVFADQVRRWITDPASGAPGRLG